MCTKLGDEFHEMIMEVLYSEEVEKYIRHIPEKEMFLHQAQRRPPDSK